MVMFSFRKKNKKLTSKHEAAEPDSNQDQAYWKPENWLKLSLPEDFSSIVLPQLIPESNASSVSSISTTSQCNSSIARDATTTRFAGDSMPSNGVDKISMNESLIDEKSGLGGSSQLSYREYEPLQEPQKTRASSLSDVEGPVTFEEKMPENEATAASGCTTDNQAINKEPVGNELRSLVRATSSVHSLQSSLSSKLIGTPVRDNNSTTDGILKNDESSRIPSLSECASNGWRSAGVPSLPSLKNHDIIEKSGMSNDMHTERLEGSSPTWISVNEEIMGTEVTLTLQQPPVPASDDGRTSFATQRKKNPAAAKSFIPRTPKQMKGTDNNKPNGRSSGSAESELMHATKSSIPQPRLRSRKRTAEMEPVASATCNTDSTVNASKTQLQAKPSLMNTGLSKIPVRRSFGRNSVALC
ncbi:uncharacterized protein BYT42DRAFT_249817 [Radiomyces spectabilis]|uniref:uncharacterized protein n=1 Tax=Radiomyces spectabilis TaxID=64574 RepID=UPI00221F5CAA|nr:uncharacterized protein BYT42DRAFT_249817 [Radiomyces spectabilis]KAI8388861.1 hypothetical protein BYT42DRAFT_249817 [Radiomyces spectabilis]